MRLNPASKSFLSFSSVTVLGFASIVISESSENFINLSDELAGTENRISVARKDYNDAVNTFNTTIKKFPNNLLAGIFGFEKAEYFRADEKSQEVPSVNFE